MHIILAGETIEILPTFENIQKVEKATGSIFAFGLKLRDGSVSFSDIVNIYYYLGSGGHSQAEIAKMLIKDGLIDHIGQVGQVFAKILSGDKAEASEVEEAGKK